ncbi:hypothetical protein BU23DRAFT_572394 [Bimuria novae-zelandiae CBS 107.79]|uniref:Uncharacterized protein n=1 Tax=Bimuria novae-zelandiae CBS 107.79 TaxID=1447943 RepID=A0A6A5UUC2_9PLEO|nr:hypothetical protein BU23DRAFT_572394 [Bimuria novae-zelandiae CBS 107.79]
MEATSPTVPGREGWSKAPSPSKSLLSQALLPRYRESSIPTVTTYLLHLYSYAPVSEGMTSSAPRRRWPWITPLANFSPSTAVSKIIQHSHTDLLVAMHHPPELRRLDIDTRATKKDPRNHSAWQTLHRFGDGVKSCHRMTRLDRWQYAIITSEDEMTTLVSPFRIEYTLKKGSCAVWIIDLKRWDTGNGWVEVKKLVDAPYAGCLRGITSLPSPPSDTPLSPVSTREPGSLPHLLVSDATQGRIYILDANNGQAPKKRVYNPPLGITALTCYRGTVYYLNTSMGTIHCIGTQARPFSPWEPVPSTLLRFDFQRRGLFRSAKLLPPCTDFVIQKKYGPEILLASPTAGIVRAYWHHRCLGLLGGRWQFHTMRRKLPSTSRSNVMAIANDEAAWDFWIIRLSKLWVGTADKPRRKSKKNKGKAVGGKVLRVEGTFE